MRHTFEEYGALIGSLALAIAVIILLSAPEDIFSNIATIDTNLYHKTSDEVRVYTQFNFYDSDSLSTFPKNIGNWGGVQYGSDEEKAMKDFKTDTVLMRKYYNGTRSVKFVLIKSENETVLHMPEVCYSADNWNITGKLVENIKPSNWGFESDIMAGVKMPANKLSIRKGNANEVVMYWYMWGEGLSRSVKNSVVFMISTPVYYNDPDETYALNTLKDFASEIVPLMYKPKERSDIIGKQIIDKFGIPGILIEFSVIALLIALIFYNRLFKKEIEE